jgi:hypothetical protein
VLYGAIVLATLMLARVAGVGFGGLRRGGTRSVPARPAAHARE